MRYAQRKPCFVSGSDRTRVPDAAKMALVTAGRIGGSDGSPRPVGGLFDFSQCDFDHRRRLRHAQQRHLVEVVLHRLRRP